MQNIWMAIFIQLHILYLGPYKYILWNGTIMSAYMDDDCLVFVKKNWHDCMRDHNCHFKRNIYASRGDLRKKFRRKHHSERNGQTVFMSYRRRLQVNLNFLLMYFHTYKNCPMNWWVAIKICTIRVLYTFWVSFKFTQLLESLHLLSISLSLSFCCIFFTHSLSHGDRDFNRLLCIMYMNIYFFRLSLCHGFISLNFSLCLFRIVPVIVIIHCFLSLSSLFLFSDSFLAMCM